MTPIEIIKQFDERKNILAEDSFLDWGDDDCPPEINWGNIKHFIINKNIARLEGEIGEIDSLYKSKLLDSSTIVEHIATKKQSELKQWQEINI